MRLTTLSLRNYANFDSDDITFDARPGRINLLVAPNGSGKSVLRNAFCDLLFGIPGQTSMGFRFGYAGMRIAADAVSPSGEHITFGRRKGQGNTLVDAEGNALDPVAVTRLLGNIDRKLLQQLFALDTEKLREGEEDLLASNGALAAALVSGAGGTRDATRLRESLAAARDALAPVRRSSQRPFYVALEQFTASRRQLSGATLKPDQWEKLEREQKEVQQRQEEQNRRADIASEEIARLERIRRVLPWLAAYDEASAWLAAHADAPSLDADLAARLADIRAAIEMTQQRAQLSRRQADQLAVQLGAIVLDAPLLAAAEAIDRLVGTAGAAHKAATDLPAVLSELDRRHSSIATLLQELGTSTDLADVATVIVPRAVITRARRLIASHREDVVTAEDAKQRITELTHGLAQIEAELTDLPPTHDTQTLEALLHEIRSEGDPARHRQTLAAAVMEAEAAVPAAVARTPSWTADAQALVNFAPLQATAYDRLGADVAAAATEEVNRHQQVDTAREALAQAESRLAAIVRPGTIITESDLRAARTHRDNGWQMIFRRAFTDEPPTADEQARFAGDVPLPLAFERAVQTTDLMADSRMREHGLVMQAELGREAVEEARTILRDAEERLRVARETHLAAARAWEQVCSSFPFETVPNVSEVHVFLAARERVIDCMRSLWITRQALRVLDDQHASWTVQLATCLALPPEQVLPLARLLASADNEVRRARETAALRARVVDRRNNAIGTLTNERAKVAAAKAAAADWIEKWRSVLNELGRPLDEEPDVTDELLQLLADLSVEHQAAAALTSRIRGMEGDNQRFAASTAAVVAAAAPDVMDHAPFDAVTELNRRLTHQRGLEKQHGLLTDQLAEAQESLGRAEQEFANQRAALCAILLLIGAESVESAEARLALSAERRRNEMRLTDAQMKLQEAGGGLTLERLRTEVAAAPPNEIEMMIDRASRDRKEASESAQAAAAQAARLAQQMERDAAAESARSALAQQQAAAATLGRVLDEALLLHVASALLGKSLEAVEATSAPELLRRISDLFRILTDDVYARVYTVSEGEGSARLVLQEQAFPGERKEVRELSDGTRDQLYLALRLAAIEEHTKVAPALPFIADDILQTFDDNRALATMRVLLAFSKVVQVILLTHHRHLLDLAGRLPPDAVHICAFRQVIPA